MVYHVESICSRDEIGKTVIMHLAFSSFCNTFTYVSPEEPVQPFKEDMKGVFIPALQIRKLRHEEDGGDCPRAQYTSWR